MAKIWYAREGNSPTIGRPLPELMGLSDRFPGKYLGSNPPKFPSLNPVLDSIRDYEYVILEVTNDDLEGVPPKFGFRHKLKQGFYQVLMTIRECEDLLQRYNA
jgi:hypothetical protein